MVSTRSKGLVMQQINEATQQQQQQLQQAGDADRLKARIPTAAEQENRLQADRAMIEVYRREWQGNKGFRNVAWRHIQDVLWWLEHVCGLNMVDYEEKVVVLCIFLAVLVLIILGAYKQSTQLVHLLKQVAMPGPA